MSRTLYPKEPRETNYHLDRTWLVDYDVVCEGGPAKWTKGYRTYLGGRIAAWFWEHIGTYGGHIVIRRNNA